MKLEEKTLRLGAAAILAAVILRIFAPSILPDIRYLFSPDGFVSLMLFGGTGRWVEASEDEEKNTPGAKEDGPLQAVFSLQELGAVTLDNPQGYAVDMRQALYTPLNWELSDGQPAVLIIHTHTTEGFANSPNWRSTDEKCNMVSIGAQVAARLEAAGIRVIHDRSVHDMPSYNDAYTSSRASIQDYLARYPSIRLVLDLHRDASADEDGNQVGHTVSYNGTDAATMMLLVSAYDYDTADEQWLRNLAFATKLQLQLEQLCPGVCRPMTLRSYSYGQDISPTGLLIEMGFAGNEQEEVLRSAQLLADAIIALQHGSQIMTPVSAS